MHILPLMLGIVLVIIGIGLIVSGKKEAEDFREFTGDDTNPNLGFAVAAFIAAFFLIVFAIRVWGVDCWIHTPIGEGLSPECAAQMDVR